MAADFSYDLLPARVILREPSQDFRSVVVNAGRRQGIELYMPVIDRNGIAGKVVQVLPGMCLVQLLKDPMSRISVMIKTSRTVGIMGTDDGRSFFLKCRAHTEVKEGDTVVTSGLGGVFPSGLNVGLVVTAGDDPDPLFKRVFVKPFVDYERLTDVFVVRLSPQWAAQRAETDSLRFGK
jgi:rod shape-determining protein MreC